MATQQAKTELQIIEEKIATDRKLRAKLKLKEKVDKFKSIPFPEDETSIIMNVLNRKKEISGSFIISKCDYEKVSQYTWCITNQGYILNREIGLLHRWLLGLEKGDKIQIGEHRDNNPLNNMRQNLRITDAAGNSRNKSKSFIINGKTTTSQYKGVNKAGEKWMANITYDRKTIHIGSFNSEIEAARAYDIKAIELFGEFAKPNGISKEVIPVRNKELKPSIFGAGIIRRGNSFVAHLTIKRQPKYLGTFKSPEEAQEARTKFIEAQKQTEQ